MLRWTPMSNAERHGLAYAMPRLHANADPHPFAHGLTKPDG